MFRFAIGLAHGKGRVTIDQAGEKYRVDHINRDGELVKTELIDVIDGEGPRDVKARAIAAVGMTMHWPSLLASIQADLRARPSTRPAELEASGTRRTTASGIILP